MLISPGKKRLIRPLFYTIKRFQSKDVPTIIEELNAAGKYLPELPKTHTGQVMDVKDPRMLRFVDKAIKHVNPNFAIDLIAELPPTACNKRVVSCDGGGPLGHPKVFINLDKPGNHTCGYCGARFYLDKNACH